MTSKEFVIQREKEVEDLCENWPKSYWAYIMEQYHKQRLEAGQNETLVIDSLPDDETIEIKFPSEVGQRIIMEKDMTYEEVRLANYYRRQGARWLRDLLSNEQ